jgi:predicted Zn-dependent protease with MMP-like domain
MKTGVEDFNSKLGRDDIFKLTIENKSLHQDSKYNGVRIVNFTRSKTVVVKNRLFLHRNLHNYTWDSSDGRTQNQIDHILRYGKWHSSLLDI